MSKKFNLSIENIRQVIPFLGLVIAAVFFQIASGGRLLSASNFPILVNHAFPVIVASCGAVFLMSQGNLDFSLTGMICLTAAITAIVSHTSIPLAILVALTMGSTLGLINGFAHAILGLPPFIATLAASFMYIGVANVLLGAGSLAATFAVRRLDNLPLKLTVLCVVLIFTFLVLEFSTFGKQCKAMGSRIEVARQSGVNIILKKLIPFMISGFACGLIAVFFISRTTTASTQTGANVQINTILALLLGGIPFSGGWAARFRCVIIGSLLMAIILNGLVVMDVLITTQQIIQGILFVVAVAISFDRKNATVIK